MARGSSLPQADEKPLQRILERLSYKGYSRGYLACCPAHGDRHPSLMVWEDPTDEHVGLKCLTGCTRKAIVEAMGLAESDLYVSSKPRALRPLQPGITLIDLAVDKLIHPHVLDQLGITDFIYKGRQAVRIPYYQQDGSEYLRTRLRTSLVAQEGSAWSAGKEPLIPYGLQRLADAQAAGYLVLVEGESDCWTLWQFHLPALGLPGAVLYLALEDTERRLQRRAKQVLQDSHSTPEVLHLAVSWPRLNTGGLEHLEVWLREHPQTRLVIVDTWTKLAPRMQGQKRTQYEEEYDALTPLKELAEKYSISILAVTHLRKMQADDVLDEISGTTGFTAHGLRNEM